MFNFGFSELVVIGIIALIFIGPKQLPEVARVVGRLLNEFKRATGDLTGSLMKTRNDADEFLRTAKEKLNEELEGALEVDIFADEEESKLTVQAQKDSQDKPDKQESQHGEG